MRAFVDGVDTFLLDCDGVIWSGDHLIPNVQETLSTLRAMGKQIIFVTNNSSKSRRAYLKKFQSLGLQASEDEIFGSAYAAAYYIRHTLNFAADKKVFVIGMSGIEEELASEGISYTGGTSDNTNLKSMGEMSTVQHDPSIGAVLFGFDLDLNYRKLARAYTYVRSDPENVHFLATNSDKTFPAGGSLYPGTGAMLAALTTPLGRMPTILGKPEQTMLDVIVNKYHLDRSRTCMVGDRLDTDVLFGKNGSLQTLLVLTGVTSPAEAAASPIKPDCVVESLGRVGLALSAAPAAQ
ncbi:HAD-like domain-containing protein [Zopfochytrium polystomum]|nr:HAD-like domain-containing protein [Zopfochytrium polystomum]